MKEQIKSYVNVAIASQVSTISLYISVCFCLKPQLLDDHQMESFIYLFNYFNLLTELNYCYLVMKNKNKNLPVYTFLRR